MKKPPKAEPIDLGAVQKRYEIARRAHKANAAYLESAAKRYDAGRKEIESAEQTLKDATRSILN